MITNINPFMQQYIGEIASPDEFVRLFSPVLVKHFLSLFQKGNIVLRGTQGSGKSMLLNLLKPEITAAYYHDTDSVLPLPKPLRRFISGGINLTRSDAVSIGQRPIGGNNKDDNQVFPYYFADFVNYWIVWDLLNSMEKMGKDPEAFGHLVNLDNLDNFAQELSAQECWFGYLNDVTNFSDLQKKITTRISTYRKFHQFNLDHIPNDISCSKTSIGEPISRTAVCLKNQHVIPSEIPVFIRIDQLEFLLESSEIRGGLGQDYRKIINKALSTRDPEISYKLGIRTYAWYDDVRIYGSETNLELERDYRIEDIDELLRRHENRRTWVLPNFAEDVFRRRLSNVGYSVERTEEASDRLIKRVFESSPNPKDIAKRYCSKTSDIRRALKLPSGFPDPWVKFLLKFFKDDPLTATLAAAWLQQTGDSRGKSRLELHPPNKEPFLWDRTYWRKERIRQALMQLAARCSQRMNWGGDSQILALSGNNILIFISMCQHIWDTYIRTQKTKLDNDKANPLLQGMPEDVQTLGILSASTHWYNKIIELPGGHQRKRLIDILGKLFRSSLLNDSKMSYPGHNGFSLTNIDWQSVPSVENFLKRAVDYGVLVAVPHTTKSPDRKPRTKWYMNPIYSPYFSIPETHVKEPKYIKIADIINWMKAADQEAISLLGIRDIEKDANSSHQEPIDSTPQLNFFEKFD